MVNFYNIPFFKHANLTTANYQLSIVNCQLSIINCPPSISKYITIILIALLSGCHTLAQPSKLEEIETYYKNQDTRNQNADRRGCLQLYPEDGNESYEIILIRHGEPDVNKKGWKGRKQAEQFALAYDTVGVLPFDNKIHCLKGVTTKKVYHSSLPRSSHTAQLLFGNDFELIEDARFREFERKVMKFVNLKMPLMFWLGTSRILWLMGLNNKDIETFDQAKSRAMENALYLAEEAKKDEQAILVAHGLHNRYVMKYLQQNGWEQVRKGGSKYLAVNILAKERPTDDNDGLLK